MEIQYGVCSCIITSKALKVQTLQKAYNSRAKINEIETKKTIEINETKSCFFEKINKIGKPLKRLIKKKNKGLYINKSELK